MKNLSKRETVLIIAALFFLALSFFMFSRNTEANEKIKTNKETIKDLQQDKEALYKDLEASEKRLKQKDSLFLVLSEKEKLFLINLNNVKNENIKNRFNYLNSNNDERFELFSRLATEKSNAR